ncbi:MAG: hypothetical protein WC449_04340 [Candidatus Paceibacterota bacterium]
MNKNKIAAAITGILCLAQMLQFAPVRALTVCPSGNCSILIEEVLLKVDGQVISDNDKSAMMTNVPFERVFLPGTQMEISVKASGPINDVAYWSLYWGTNDTPSLINSDRTICAKCPGEKYVPEGAPVFNVKWAVPKDAKKYSKIWIQSFDQTGKTMGGANTRPLVHSQTIIKPNCYVSEIKDVTESSATAIIHFARPGSVWPLNSWLELRSDSGQYFPNHSQPLGMKTFQNAQGLTENQNKLAVVLKDLLPNSKYWVKAIAASEGGYCESREVELITLCALPQLKTLRCSKIDWNQNSWNQTDNSAYLTCEITSFGGDNYMEVMVQGFNINAPRERFGTTWQRLECSQFDQLPSEFTLQAGKGFTAEEVYDFEFLARNSRGEIASGGHKYFPPPFPGYKPEIVTGGVKKVTPDSVELVIKVVSISHPTKIWLEITDQKFGDTWDRGKYTPDPNGKSILSDSLEVDLPGEYTITVKNLEHNRGMEKPPSWVRKEYPHLKYTPGYLFKAHALDLTTNETDKGTDWSRLETYRTLQKPKVTTKQPINITYKSADLGAMVDFSGFSSKCVIFFKYWQKGKIAQTIQETFPRIQVETRYDYVDFELMEATRFTVENLEPYTVYCFQAYVINGLTNSTGEQIETPAANIQEFRTLWGDKNSIYDTPLIQTTGVSQTGPNTFCLQGKLLDFGGSDWVEVTIEFWGLSTHFEGEQSFIYVGLYRKENWQDRYPTFDVYRSNLVFGKSFVFRFTARSSAGTTKGFLIDSSGQKVEGGFWKFQTDPLPGDQVKPEIFLKGIKILMPDQTEENPTPQAIITINVQNMGTPPLPWLDLQYLWTRYSGSVIAAWPNTWQYKSEKIRITKAGEYSFLINKGLEFGRSFFISVNAENGSMLTWMVPESKFFPHYFTTDHLPPLIKATNPTFINKQNTLANTQVIHPGTNEWGTFFSWFEVVTFRGSVDAINKEITVLPDTLNPNNQLLTRTLFMTPKISRKGTKPYSFSINADPGLLNLPDEQSGSKIISTYYAYRAWAQNQGGQYHTSWIVVTDDTFQRMDKMPWEKP